MPVNLDKPQLWKEDTKASVDHYNKWFMRFAPKAFRETRIEVTKHVEQAVVDTDDMRSLTPELLLTGPRILQTLRMSCCPPLAVDRLVGLAYTNKGLVDKMENGKLSLRMPKGVLRTHLENILVVITKLLDPDIFVWLPEKRKPTKAERHRASTIVADRLSQANGARFASRTTTAVQLSIVEDYLEGRGYRRVGDLGQTQYGTTAPGTYMVCVNIPVALGNRTTEFAHALIQPFAQSSHGLPIVVEAKSCGSFADARRQRFSSASKLRSLRMTYGEKIRFALVLNGYFGADYLGTQAAEGIDWIWLHRPTDLQALGL